MRSSRRDFLLTATAAQVDFRAQTALVRVHVEVLSGGRPVRGLTKSDFEVLDNGKPVEPVDLVESEEPLDLVLLYDISGSMEPRVMEVARHARAALSELRSGDRVAVITFSRWTKVTQELTSDIGAVETSISRDVLGADFKGDTHLLAAVDEAAKYIARRSARGRRRAVVIFTDNRGAVTVRENTVVRRLWEADASLSLVELPLAPYEGPGMGSRLAGGGTIYATVDKVVAQTGGDVVRGGPPNESFRTMMRMLRTRLVLMYAMPPAKPGEVRTISVSLRQPARQEYPDAVIRARGGYVAPRPIE